MGGRTNVWNGEDWSHLPEDRDKLWVQINILLQFRAAWKCGECLYQLINAYICPEAIRTVGSVSQSLQATTSAVSTSYARRPSQTVHYCTQTSSVTLCRILVTCHKCRCPQRILLPKWGQIRRYCANGPHGLFMAVRYAQLPSSNYTSTPSLFVSFPQLNLHCSAVQHSVEQTENVSNFFTIFQNKKEIKQRCLFNKQILRT
jgi:hypothetical protein